MYRRLLDLGSVVCREPEDTWMYEPMRFACVNDPFGVRIYIYCPIERELISHPMGLDQGETGVSWRQLLTGWGDWTRWWRMSESHVVEFMESNGLRVARAYHVHIHEITCLYCHPCQDCSSIFTQGLGDAVGPER